MQCFCCFRLFSRVEPAHKSKIVGYLQDDGAVSAMVSLLMLTIIMHKFIFFVVDFDFK